MAHNITQREDSKYEFAYSGEPAWHGLGSELQPDASIETWIKEAGLDWEVFESALTYSSYKGVHTFPDKRVLFRSDTQAPLSVVSSDYHVVQPAEVLEFFRDLTTLNGFKLSAAGSLFGGKRFWATAEIGKSFKAVDGDVINGQLLLVTSVDGTLSTQAKVCSTRVVCNNTLTVALGESQKRAVKKTHASAWDAKEVKLDLGLIDSGWEQFSANIKKLAETKVTDEFVRNYLQSKFYAKDVLIQDQGIGAIKKVNTLMSLYKDGTGSEYSTGTAWGVLNAATELFTHGMSKKRDTGTQFWNSNFGKDEALKNDVYSDMLALIV